MMANRLPASEPAHTHSPITQYNLVNQQKRHGSTLYILEAGNDLSMFIYIIGYDLMIENLPAICFKKNVCIPWESA